MPWVENEVKRVLVSPYVHVPVGPYYSRSAVDIEVEPPAVAPQRVFPRWRYQVRARPQIPFKIAWQASLVVFEGGHAALEALNVIGILGYLLFEG